MIQANFQRRESEEDAIRRKAKLQELCEKFNQRKVIQFHLKLQEYRFYYDMRKMKQARKSQLVVFLDVINIPLTQLVKMTVPPTDEEKYDHEGTIAWPIFGYIFLMLNFFGMPNKNWVYFFPVSLAMQFLFQYFQPQVRTTKPKYFFVLVLFGVLCGVLWNMIISEILVSALNFIGILFGVSKAFLGMVVLSIGNALPDGMTTISIA